MIAIWPTAATRGGLEGNCDTAGATTNESGSCDDGFACVETTTCTAGVCGGGVATDCSGTADDCNLADSCDPGGFEGNCDTAGATTNESGSCDDGFACVETTTCTAGVCGGGVATDCSGTADDCNLADSCDPGGLEGNCDTAGATTNESGSCDDGFACVETTTCTACGLRRWRCDGLLGHGR